MESHTRHIQVETEPSRRERGENGNQEVPERIEPTNNRENQQEAVWTGQ